MKETILPILIILFLALSSCKKSETVPKGVLTNSQIHYDLVGTHNYPRIHFFGRIENFSKDSIKVILENRSQVSSRLNQFLWFLEDDTLQLISYSFDNIGEQKVSIPPDSTFRFVLRTGDLAFWDEDKMELSDSTYYKNMLINNSTKGEIYFVTQTGERILMGRKEPFQIIEGY
ncbi:hypothetical protein [Gracilimonas tropica]|uniref:hypothetical protein n=1 Tax=Gracilimonas tropica TaxID=454600 RepID=UPI00037ADD95|nr:hypothetical protein [Gracilimonas tropica]